MTRPLEPFDPSERTSFVGRSAEAARLDAAFAEGARLVTLVGPAGMGKTRLARRWVARHSEPKPSFCELAEARTLEDLVATVAAHADVPVPSGATEAAAAALGRALRARGARALVLDNVEQLVASSAAAVGRWLDAAPELVLLATSRERLGVAGEAVIELAPLDAIDGARLFDDRARAAEDGLARPHDREVVAELVRRLDGIPLAIELAAAQVDVLAPRDLLRRLATRLDLLRSTASDTPDRHRTLRAAMDGSWELLDPGEREALMLVSVYRGGFTLEAAEAVLGEEGATAVGKLRALVAKSLVVRRRDDDDTIRFRLYESVRDYADEKLVASGARSAALERQAGHLLSRLETAILPELAVARPERMADLDREAENLFAVLRGARGRDATSAARAALVLEPWLLARHPSSTSKTVLDEALDPPPDDPLLTARLACARGNALRLAGKSREAKVDLERALELARAASATRDGAASVAARALAYLASVALDTGRVEEAEARAREAIATGSAKLEARARNILAIVALRRGDRAAAEADTSRALELARAAGDATTEVNALANLAKSRSDEGKNDEAEEHVGRAITRASRAGDRRFEGPLGGLAVRVAHDRGDLARARALCDAAISAHRATGNTYYEHVALDARALLDLEEGEIDRAEATLVEVLDRVRAERLRTIEGFVLAHLAAALALRGRLDAAGKKLDEARAGWSTAPEVAATTEAIAGFVDVARGRLDEARARALAAEEPARSSFHVRVAKRLLDRAIARRTQAPGPRSTEPDLIVGDDARWFRLERGEPVDLARRGGLRKMLVALVRARLERPGVALSTYELVDAGWPGERVDPDVGARRVYTSVGVLRDLGLRAALVLRDDGYLIDPALEVAWG